MARKKMFCTTQEFISSCKTLSFDWYHETHATQRSSLLAVWLMITETNQTTSSASSCPPIYTNHTKLHQNPDFHNSTPMAPRSLFFSSTCLQNIYAFFFPLHVSKISTHFFKALWVWHRHFFLNVRVPSSGAYSQPLIGLFFVCFFSLVTLSLHFHDLLPFLLQQVLVPRVGIASPKQTTSPKNTHTYTPT